METLRQKFIDTGLSKILIYRDNIDNIIGYVHSFELMKKPEQIKQILLPIGIVPESMPANQVLNDFINNKRNITVVVDEFGGTSGMLTIEDVVEEIFGEIEDEHDKEDLIETQIGSDTFRFSARIEIDYVNEKYDLQLPDGDEYETLGGLIIHIQEEIPAVGMEIEYEKWQFTIMEVSDTRIELVEVKILEEA